MSSSMNPSMSPMGKVYLIGAGPGAADLITVRGAKLLAQADVVLHDALVEPELLELCPQAKHIAVGKRCGKLSTSQRFINKRLVDAAYQHTTVVRLKGGDPMLFGRADEELAALEDAGIAYEIIPGITAAQAGAASLGRSLTLRGVARSIAFVTHAKAKDDEAQESLLAPPCADTMVYYMARAHAVEIAKNLIKAGRKGSTPVHLLESISTSRERTWSMTLDELADQSKPTENDPIDWQTSDQPLLVLIGDALAKRAGREINNGTQDRLILTDRRRSA
jgi:uroporphyrin-III C-methyltransferase